MCLCTKFGKGWNIIVSYNYLFEPKLEWARKSHCQFGNLLHDISECHDYEAFSKMVIVIRRCIQLCRKGSWTWDLKQGGKQPQWLMFIQAFELASCFSYLQWWTEQWKFKETDIYSRCIWTWCLPWQQNQNNNR